MNHPNFEKIWRNPSISKLVWYIVFNEGHCITQWSTFCSKYSKLGNLQYLLPARVPFYVASATLPDATVKQIKDVLNLRDANTKSVMWSNDCPEISISVWGMKYSACLYRDLNLLIPKNFKNGDLCPPRFLVFFNNTKEAEAACKHLRRRLPKALQHKLCWFHSTMTPRYREDHTEWLVSNEDRGLFTMELFGVVWVGVHIKVLLTHWLCILLTRASHRWVYVEESTVYLHFELLSMWKHSHASVYCGWGWSYI